MDTARYLACLNDDVALLQAAAEAAPEAPVPTCPDWAMPDLVRHVAAVYLHKVAAIRDGAEPDEWPPPGLNDAEPLPLLDRALGELLDEFAHHEPGDPAGSWYGPDQTVGFWIRRMAQETVIHRIDAQLAAGLPVTPVPDDLAVDGIDEVLRIFASYGVAAWGEYFTGILDSAPAHVYLVTTDDQTWRVSTAPGHFDVEDEAADDAGDVSIVGPPEDVLRWLWNRGGRPAIVGPGSAIDVLRACLTTATQ